MTDEQFLQALYQGLLGRQPDPAGLEHHLAQLRQTEADPQRYRRLVEAFATGEEARLLAERRWLPAGSNALLPDLSGVQFGHALPLGTFCHAASALKRVGMRQSAGPFDWLFSNLGMVTHCVQDDFATFLDRQHFRSVPVEERISPEANFGDHAYYREKHGVQFVFNHHDPAASEEDAAHFERAVQRWRGAMASPAWKLFVLVSVQGLDLKRLTPLLEALRTRTRHFVVLALQFKTLPADAAGAASTERLLTERLAHDALKVTLNVSAPSNGVEFGAAQDEQLLERLLRSFRYKAETAA